MPTQPIAPPPCADLVDLSRVTPAEGGILIQKNYQADYTDIGAEREANLVGALRDRAWRDVVREAFAESQPWLHQIITSPLRAALLDAIDLPGGGQFLDVGSGWGQLAIPLARRGAVAALDQTVGRLHILAEIARQEQVQLSLHCGGIEAYPFRDGRFDAIFFNGSLEYMCGDGAPAAAFAAQSAVLRRARQLLTHEGFICVAIENAVGLKYLLGAPDDHTGRPGTSYQIAADSRSRARTWPLDRYHELFAAAGLTPVASYACFPDYKLIRRLTPLDEVDALLAAQGLPAPEHSGADGAALPFNADLDALYRTFGRLGLARYVAPSYAFVLREHRAADVRAPSIERVRRIVGESGAIRDCPADELRITPVPKQVRHRGSQQTQRYQVHRLERPVASVKCVPVAHPFDPDAILAVYEHYRACRAFRPVRLLGSARDEHSLWLVEEYMPAIRSLDDLVRDGIQTAAEATMAMTAVVDDVWGGGAPLDRDLLERELAGLREPFRAAIENESVALALYAAFCANVRANAAQLRTIWSTRDYIGRNIALAPDGARVLLDYDLATRTTLFALDVARNRIHVPYCTEAIFDAQAFEGLDRRLVEIAAVAAECALQTRVQPTSQHDDVRLRHRRLMLQLIDGTAAVDSSAAAALRETSPAEAGGGSAADSPDAATSARAAWRAALEEARARQRHLESELAAAQAVGIDLGRAVQRLQFPPVDVLLVNYNGLRWIDGFVTALENCDYPRERLRVVFVDNASTDGSPEEMQRRMAALAIETEFVQAGRNAGFTGGYALAFEKARAEYLFVLNTDTVMAPDAIRKLVEVMNQDATIGIAEARQAPHEHPKYYDPVTRETSWCSGACMLVRARALEQVGGGFEPTFFMYAEDVDLSWRMWLRGWRCVYVPEAVVTHFTEQLDPQRNPGWQHYFSVRNGALMRVLYGSPGEIVLHYLAILRVALRPGNPGWHRWLSFKAILTSVQRWPAALRGRRTRAARGRHPWVFFDGWLYGRHLRDIAARPDPGVTITADLLASFSSARLAIREGLRVADHISLRPGVYVGGHSLPAVVVFDSAEITYTLSLAPESLLCGAVAAPQDTWRHDALGQFEVLQDGERVWTTTLDLDRPDHRRWVSFEIPLRTSAEGRPSDITLRFSGLRQLAWGLWGQLRIGSRSVAFDPGSSRVAAQAAGPYVSIVIPTHNRADAVSRVIKRLIAQDIPTDYYELVVVDSNSKDHTPVRLAELARQHPTLTALRCEKSGAAAARNMGMEVARGRLVLLLDDDILVAPDFLRRLLAAHRDHPDRVLLGHIEAPWEGTADPFHRYLLQAQDVNVYDFADPANVPANYFFTACVAIPRDVLGATRFDEGFRVYGVEDIDFGFRLLSGDTRMVYRPELKVWHEYYPRYRPYLVKKFKAGYSLGYFVQQNPQHAHRFVFEAAYTKYYHLLRVWHALTAPAAGLLYLWERIRHESGPVKASLYRWLYRDLRLTLYAGMRRFRRGAPPP